MDDGGLQYWQQLGQLEQLEQLNNELENINEHSDDDFGKFWQREICEPSQP